MDVIFNAIGNENGLDVIFNAISNDNGYLLENCTV
jgi:hypothetical protein